MKNQKALIKIFKSINNIRSLQVKQNKEFLKLAELIKQLLKVS